MNADNDIKGQLRGVFIVALFIWSDVTKDWLWSAALTCWALFLCVITLVKAIRDEDKKQ